MSTNPAELAAANGYTSESLVAAEQATTASDISARHLLEMIFGTIANDPIAAIGGNAGAGDILGTIFMYINMGLLTLGSIYLTYQTLAAITETAHHGEFMGKRISTVWAPVRIITGIFSLIPIAGGWSIIQVAMLWVGIMGAGLGNMAWQGVVDADFKPFSTMTLSPPANGSFSRNFVPELFKMNVCVEAHNAQILESGWGKREDFTNRVIQYGSHNGENAECGRVLLSDTSAGVASTQGQSSIINTSFDFDKTLNAQAKLQRDAINAALDNEFRLIDQKTDELAKTWINDPNGGIAAIINNPDAVDHIIKYDTVAIANLSTEYQKRLTDAIARSMKEVDALPAAQKEMKARAQADGFTSAGAWYGIMAQSSYLMNSLVQNVAPSIGAGATPPHDDESVWRKAYDYIQAAQETQQTPGKANAGGTAHDSSNDWWKEVKQFIGNDHNIIGQEGIANVITESSGKPVMLRLKDIADYMIDISTIIVTAIAGVMGYWNDTIVGKLGDLSGFAAGAHGVAKVWMNMVTFVLQIAIGFFLMMSIYLPMVPFIIFMGQVLNWLVTVVEGVAAAPFLAFAHFDTDGEGLGHKTQYGYTFMLQSFMRPVMLVLGFVFGAMLLEAIGGYVMVIYPTVVANVQIDSMTGLFSTIGFIALFFVIMVGLVTTCFSVTYLLPDAIFAFIGAQSSATSQTGRHETQNAEKSGLTGAGISRTVQPGLDHTGAATRQEKKAADAGVRLAMPKSGNCE